jgi:hypothetical protein
VADELPARGAEVDAQDELAVGLVIGMDRHSAGIAPQAYLSGWSRRHEPTFAAFTVVPDESRGVLICRGHGGKPPPPRRASCQTSAPAFAPTSTGYPLIEGVVTE